MKKWLLGLSIFILAVFISGCTKIDKGNYKEGTYFGFDEVNKYTAVIYVDATGYIKSVFIDAAYLGKDNTGKSIATTKQILGDAYGMKGKGTPVATYEWYEQANKVANKVLTEQGIDWLQFKYRVVGTDGNATFTDTKPGNQTEANKVYTDTVSGVTISVNGIYNAINNALDKAQL